MWMSCCFKHSTSLSTSVRVPLSRLRALVWLVIVASFLSQFWRSCTTSVFFLQDAGAYVACHAYSLALSWSRRKFWEGIAASCLARAETYRAQCKHFTQADQAKISEFIWIQYVLDNSVQVDSHPAKVGTKPPDMPRCPNKSACVNLPIFKTDWNRSPVPFRDVHLSTALRPSKSRLHILYLIPTSESTKCLELHRHSIWEKAKKAFLESEQSRNSGQRESWEAQRITTVTRTTMFLWCGLISLQSSTSQAQLNERPTQEPIKSMFLAKIPWHLNHNMVQTHTSISECPSANGIKVKRIMLEESWRCEFASGSLRHRLETCKLKLLQKRGVIAYGMQNQTQPLAEPKWMNVHHSRQGASQPWPKARIDLANSARQICKQCKWLQYCVVAWKIQHGAPSVVSALSLSVLSTTDSFG